VTNISGILRFDAADVGMFTDWLPDGVEKDADDIVTDDEKTNDDEQEDSDGQSVDNTNTDDSDGIKNDSYSSEDTENSVNGFTGISTYFFVSCSCSIYRHI
jgi:hypothetical protein